MAYEKDDKAWPWAITDSPVPQAQSTPVEPVPPRRYEIVFEVEVGHGQLPRLDFVLLPNCSLTRVQQLPARQGPQSTLQTPSTLDREKSTAERPRSRVRLAERVEDLGHPEWAKVVEILEGPLRRFVENGLHYELALGLVRLEDYLDSLDSKQKGG